MLLSQEPGKRLPLQVVHLLAAIVRQELAQRPVTQKHLVVKLGAAQRVISSEFCCSSVDHLIGLPTPPVAQPEVDHQDRAGGQRQNEAFDDEVVSGDAAENAGKHRRGGGQEGHRKQTLVDVPTFEASVKLPGDQKLFGVVGQDEAAQEVVDGFADYGVGTRTVGHQVEPIERNVLNEFDKVALIENIFNQNASLRNLNS